jgi:hypothetical protein
MQPNGCSTSQSHPPQIERHTLGAAETLRFNV